MSRCFPFPPPGYERKGRIDDVDLLKKEKDKEKKEKKEKKDKKDKEKKEKKEKREKDSSDGKHRDKKDKKEKHRDKEKKRDKEKDKDKAKDKSSASDEKRLSGQIESRGGEKSFQKEVKERESIVDKKFAGQSGGSIKGEKPGQNSHLVDANKDSKLVQELGRRIKDDSRGTGTQFENFGAPDRKKDEGMVRLVAKGSGILAEAKEKEKRATDRKMDGQGIRDGARSGGNATVQGGAGMVQTKVEGIRDGARSGGNATVQGGAGTVQTKVERIRDGGRSGGNATFQSTAGMAQTKVEGIRDGARSGGNATAQSAAGTVQTKVEGIREGARSGGNAMFQSTAGMVQTKVEGLPRPMDKSVDRKMEGKEKAKEKGSDDKRGSKSKEKNREKKSHGKDKDRDKERKKEEKAKEKSQLKKAELDKLRGSNNDIVGNHAIKTPILKDSKTSAVLDGNPKKRKDFETNGVGHAFDGLPSKLPRPTISSHPTKENGRILEHCPTSVLNASDREEEALDNLKIDNKERKLNGKIEAQTMPVTPAKRKSVTAQVDPFAEAATRPPHPDSKYLSQIYSVPKMPELPDYDDQEWLFSSKKPRVESSPAEEPSQVWAEAQPIESADIIALPYVIPY